MSVHFINFSKISKILAIGFTATSLVLFSSPQAVNAQNYNLPPGGSTAGSASNGRSGASTVPQGTSGTTTTPANNPGVTGTTTTTPANNPGVNRILAMYGLIPAACNVGVVQVMVSLQESVCAYPTSQYPSGTYVLNQQDFSLRPVGGTTTTPPVPQPVETTQPSLPGTWSPQGTIVPDSPASSSPSIVVIGNSSQAVPTDISAQISSSMAARGLTLMACNANPPVTIVVNSYMACANSTATYPPGRYTLR